MVFIQSKLDPSSKPHLQHEIEQAYAALQELGAGKGDMYGMVGDKVLHSVAAMIDVSAHKGFADISRSETRSKLIQTSSTQCCSRWRTRPR